MPRLFALADASGNNSITPEEFEEGWDEMMKTFLDQATAEPLNRMHVARTAAFSPCRFSTVIAMAQSSRGFGLSEEQIYATITVSVGVLVLLFTFLFFALSAWCDLIAFRLYVDHFLMTLRLITGRCMAGTRSADSRRSYRRRSSARSARRELIARWTICRPSDPPP